MSKNKIANYLISLSVFFVIISVSAKVLFLYYGTLPTFNQIRTVRILRFERNTAFISLIIDVENKNIIPFVIKNANLYAYDFKQKIGDVFIDNEVIVSGNTSTMLRLQLSIPKERIESLVLNEADSLNLELQGQCIMKMLGINKKILINEKISIPVRTMMNEYVFRSFQYAIFSEIGTINPNTKPMQLVIPLKFRNESGIDVYIADLKSQVYINQTLAGTGNIESSFQLADKYKNIPSSLVFSLSDWQSLGYSASNFVKDRLNYRIEGKLDLTVWNKPYKIIIDMQGEAKIKE